MDEFQGFAYNGKAKPTPALASAPCLVRSEKRIKEFRQDFLVNMCTCIQNA
jgi:hypothetical protein